MKLLSITKCNDGKHKYCATFQTDKQRTKTTKFGAVGYDDYTITHDKEQRERYRKRHEKDLTTNDPTKAGFLSFFVLWGRSTSIQANIQSYKAKFHL